MNTWMKRMLAFALLILMAGPVLAQKHTATLSVDGKPLLALKVPPAAKVTSTNGYLNVHTTNMSLHVSGCAQCRDSERRNSPRSRAD